MIKRTLEREQARKLRAEGKSIRDIAQILRISKGSISPWVRDIELTPQQEAHLKESERLGAALGRKKVAEEWKLYKKHHLEESRIKTNKDRRIEAFFHNWNSKMAYVLGFFAADGSMYINKTGGRYIAFYSTDFEIIESIKQIMDAPNNIEVKSRAPYKTSYCLQIGSKKIFNRLIKLGFTPNKSLTLKFPPVPRDLLRHFARGYFDGDGCAYFNPNMLKRRKTKIYSIKIVNISFRCGSETFIRQLQERLNKEAHVGLGNLYFHYGAFTLRYSLRDVIELYSFIYPSLKVPHLRRKREVLEKGINCLRP